LIAIEAIKAIEKAIKAANEANEANFLKIKSGKIVLGRDYTSTKNIFGKISYGGQ